MPATTKLLIVIAVLTAAIIGIVIYEEVRLGDANNQIHALQATNAEQLTELEQLAQYEEQAREFTRDYAMDETRYIIAYYTRSESDSGTRYCWVYDCNAGEVFDGDLFYDLVGLASENEFDHFILADWDGYEIARVSVHTFENGNRAWCISLLYYVPNVILKPYCF